MTSNHFLLLLTLLVLCICTHIHSYACIDLHSHILSVHLHTHHLAHTRAHTHRHRHAHTHAHTCVLGLVPEGNQKVYWQKEQPEDGCQMGGAKGKRKGPPATTHTFVRMSVCGSACACAIACVRSNISSVSGNTGLSQKARCSRRHARARTYVLCVFVTYNHLRNVRAYNIQ
jgi:hypothetical protein